MSFSWRAPTREPLVVVGPSTVHGIGAFASSYIEAGTILYTGIEWSDVVYLTPEDACFSNDTAILYKGRIISAPGVESWSRFLNHSDDANVGINDDCDLVTLNSVDPGCELFLDYRQCVHPSDPTFITLFGELED